MLSPSDPLHTTQALFLADLLGTFERTGEARRAVFLRPPHGTVEGRWRIYADARHRAREERQTREMAETVPGRPASQRGDQPDAALGAVIRSGS